MKKVFKAAIAAAASCAVLSAVALTTAYANSDTPDSSEINAESLNNAIIANDDVTPFDDVDLFAYADSIKQADGINYKAAEHYGINANGDTYGSSAWATGTADEPDLILAESDDGKIGYIYADDLDVGAPESPEKAAEWCEEHKDYTINVYESDGETIIGEFTVGNK